MKVSAILWNTTNKNGLYPIKIKLYNSTTRRNKYISTGLNIPKRCWSDINNKVLKNHKDHKEYNRIINNLIESYNISNIDFDTQNINDVEFGTLGDLLLERIKDFQSQNRIPAVKRYNTLLNHLRKVKIDKVELQDLNKEHIRLLNHYFINDRKLSNGALKNYHKVIKTCLTYAEDNPRFKLPRANPYHKFQKIKDDGGTKITLSLSNIHQLDESLHFDCNSDTKEFHSTAYFLFSFYLMGMRFKDLILLKWSDVKYKELIYTMSKTKTKHHCYLNDKALNILKYYLPLDIYIRNTSGYKKSKKIESKKIFELEVRYRQFRETISNKDLTQSEELEFQKIIKDRDALLRKVIYNYSLKNKDYIFGYKLEGITDPLKRYNKISSISAQMNKCFKSIAFNYDIEPFSFYSSRHTFAYNFKKATGDIHKVSKALAHSSVSITEVYLKGFKSEELYKDTDDFYNDMNTLYKV